MEVKCWEVECLDTIQRTKLNFVLLGLNFGIKSGMVELCATYVV